MSEQEKETKNPNEIVDIVGIILEFNGKQKGQGLKKLTPNQVLSRLPISLAQLKAGYHSEKIKNETRKLLYFFVQIKKTYKNIYKSLIESI